MRVARLWLYVACYLERLLPRQPPLGRGEGGGLSFSRFSFRLSRVLRPVFHPYGRAKHPSRPTFAVKRIGSMPGVRHVTKSGGCCRPYECRAFHACGGHRFAHECNALARSVLHTTGAFWKVWVILTRPYHEILCVPSERRAGHKLHAGSRDGDVTRPYHPKITVVAVVTSVHCSLFTAFWRA
jgi:hypothetical protein